MKILHRFLHWLGASPTKTKIPETVAPEIAAEPPAPAVLKVKPVPYTDDDSPPGYKIRWYH